MAGSGLPVASGDICRPITRATYRPSQETCTATATDWRSTGGVQRHLPASVVRVPYEAVALGVGRGRGGGGCGGVGVGRARPVPHGLLEDEPQVCRPHEHVEEAETL